MFCVNATERIKEIVLGKVLWPQVQNKYFETSINQIH